MTKPSSGAAIDGAHALASGLTAAWAMLEGTGTTSVDSQGTNHLTLSSAGLWSTDANGALLSSDGSTVRPAALTTAINHGGADDWTVCIGYKQNAVGNDGILFGKNGGTTDYYYAQGATRTRVKINNTNRDFAGGDWTTQTNAVIAYDASAQTLTLFIDGVQYGQLSSVSSAPLEFDTLLNGYTTADFALAGTVSYCYYYDARALTLSEALSVHNDPYLFFEVGGGGTVTIDTPQQVIKTTGTLTPYTISGTWISELSDSVQVRILLAADDSVIADWAEVDGTLSSGTWSGSVNMPTGGPFNLEVRLLDVDSNILDTTRDTTDMLIGHVFLATGQSNANGRALVEQTYSGTSTAWKVSRSGVIAELVDHWAIPVVSGEGSWGPLLATLIDASQSVPTIWLVNAQGGRPISDWQDSPPGTRWASITSQVAALNAANGITACLWLQGETDAAQSMTTVTYQAAESDFADAVATLAGTPPVISSAIGFGSTWNPQEVNAAKLANWDAELTLYGPWIVPISLTGGDTIHFQTQEQIARLAALWWLSIEDALFGGTNGRGPRIVAASNIDASNNLDLTFDRDLDTDDTTYTSTILTVDNDDGTVRTVSSISRTGIRTVRAILSGPMDGTSPKLNFGLSETLTGATIPKTAPIALPATINSISEQPLYAESAESFAIATGVITITSPVSTDRRLVGVAETITWTSSGVANVDIDISVDNGLTWGTLSAGEVADGSYDWTPQSNQIGDSIKLRITDAINSNTTNTTDAFTVATTSALSVSDLWYRLKQAAIDNGLEIIEQ